MRVFFSYECTWLVLVSAIDQESDIIWCGIHVRFFDTDLGDKQTVSVPVNFNLTGNKPDMKTEVQKNVMVRTVN